MRIPTIEVHYSTDCYDTDKIISEENRHVLVYQDRICKAQRGMADFRQETFSSEAACQEACQDWVEDTRSLLQSKWAHWWIDQTHPPYRCDGSIAW